MAIEIQKVKDAHGYFEMTGTTGFQATLADLMPKTMGEKDCRRLIAQMLLAANKDPKIYNCTKSSIAQCIFTLADFALSPLPELAEAYLIPYGNDLQVNIGYRGMMKMIVERGHGIADMDASVVRENDTFSYRLGLNPGITHEVPRGERGKLTHVYAVALFRTGYKKFVVMDLEEVEAVRAKSKAKNSFGWTEFYDQMARAKVVRRLAKFLPLENGIAALVLDEENAESHAYDRAPYVKPPDRKGGVEALAAQLSKGKKTDVKNETAQENKDAAGSYAPTEQEQKDMLEEDFAAAEKEGKQP